MVAPEDDYLVWVSYFKGEEKADDFATLLASIDIIAHEQILSRGIYRNNPVLLVLLVLVAHFLEHVQQICELAVNIPKYFDWGFKGNKRLLVLKYFLNLLDKEFDHLRRQVHERN